MKTLTQTLGLGLATLALVAPALPAGAMTLN